MKKFYVDVFYNINMKVFGYSISLNVLILMGILYLIMVVNALSGSCNREGFKGIKKKINKMREQVVNPVVPTYNDPGPTRVIPPNVNKYQADVARAAAAAQDAANQAAVAMATAR
jgi:hypothetical protein